MTKIGICDDEPALRESLAGELRTRMERRGEPFCIDCYANGGELLRAPLDFNILFLDIQMPGPDGLALARELRARGCGCVLIFITVLKECALDAFAVEAADYLCKPVDGPSLDRALERALRLAGERKSLFVQTAHWSRSVPLDTLYYCEVINRKIYLHTAQGVIEYYGKLEEVEAQLDDRFAKCHRSYLVNLDHLRLCEDGQVTLENGETVPISRPRRQSFLSHLLHRLS